MKLKELRRQKGFDKQLEFAKALGVSQTVVSKWEQGVARPKLDTIKKLAEILQVSVEEIVACFQEGDEEMCKAEMQAILDKPVLDYEDISKLLSVSKSTAYKWIAEIQGYAEKQGYPKVWGKKVRSSDFKEFMRI